MQSGEKIIVISLGGSIVLPEPGKINLAFLKKFKKLILSLSKKGFRFIIVVGGGKTARLYQEAASKTTKVSNQDKDWLGIYATYLNAHLVRIIFGKEAHPIVLNKLKNPVKNNWKILVASGFEPGYSTDYVAVLLAKRFKTKKIINASNIYFVYDKNPKKYKKAKAFKKISWPEFRKVIGSEWLPGLSSPFDPIAAKLAEKLKFSVFIIKGTEIKNFENLLLAKNFKGTVIRPFEKTKQS